jgi:hypothetical protein
MIPLTAYAAAARPAELARQRLDATHFLPDRPAKRRLRMPRLVIALVIAMGAVGPLTPLAHAGPAGPIVPSAIQVPDGNKPFLLGHAIGVQIYACNAIADGFAWAFVAPRATLYDDNGKPIATHSGGPTWQATDGSKVVGRRLEGVTVDPTAISWLLLSAASTSAGPDGARLADTTYVQRVNTVGGLTPPAAGCDTNTVTTVEEVPYTADYYFWKAQP